MIKKRKQVSVEALLTTAQSQCLSVFVFKLQFDNKYIELLFFYVMLAYSDAFLIQNSAMLERIEIYRGGVGDGQVSAAYEHKLP
ncbi:unnamed protein product [Rotaria magnacalcarata]|uniref:Uncharacterized protein n=1 Tax=Rotaria magnacalcarata TaxID=392030 RepID=A0A820D046_9BILA|nr:unnamed protein product [Rotaria magnacalcarata]CAF3800639.1 unnamed protein product [Rotaria magnacalcarata]CAF4151462.1 unnamed protein product [Rotaria magnacalcarata]CAF4223594.1 unnamed protein product [Rotaria magnacalcarata]CAF5057594.1 unnamed protein product [Rotaria magnacalcarata]